MSSFPLMRDLPQVVETTGWSWRSYEAPVAPSMNFWIGTDREGNRWLTKLTGDFCAYREIVFARLAQRMHWSCQSSVFMRLDESSANEIGAKPGGGSMPHTGSWTNTQTLHATKIATLPRWLEDRLLLLKISRTCPLRTSWTGLRVKWLHACSAATSHLVGYSQRSTSSSSLILSLCSQLVHALSTALAGGVTPTRQHRAESNWPKRFAQTCLRLGSRH